MALSEAFYWFVLVGQAAQLVDGALGMAFGMVSSSVLLSMGLPPATDSAGVHVRSPHHRCRGAIAPGAGQRRQAPVSAPGAAGHGRRHPRAYVPTRLSGDAIRPFVHLSCSAWRS